MTDYRDLSDFDKNRIDDEIKRVIEPKDHVTKNGLKLTEPDYTLNRVHNGDICADCLMIYYNCLCGHGS